MKTTVLEMAMEMKREGMGVKVKFATEIKGHISTIITNEQDKAISEHISAITEIMNQAIKEDLMSELEKMVKEEEKIAKEDEISDLQKKLYEAMPEDMQKEIDEFERKMASFDTDEERAEYAFKQLLKDMKKMERMMR